MKHLKQKSITLKTILINTFLVIIISLFTFSCSKNDDPVSRGITLYETNASWMCLINESCQDVYEFEFEAGSKISITIQEVTGNSLVRLAVYAPNVNLGSTNLLTGNTNDLACSGRNETASIPNLIAPSSGIYKIAITRDWGTSIGNNGTYKLVLFADTEFEFIEKTIDDIDSLTSDFSCP